MNKYCVFKELCINKCETCMGYSNLELIDYKEYPEEIKFKGEIIE